MVERDSAIERRWSVIELLNATREFFVSKEFQNPRTNAEMFLGHVLGCSRIDLYLKHDRPVTREEQDALRELIKRRLNHEPPQYIVGETEFYGIRMRVAKGVLIPRPETEIVAEKAIDAAKKLIAERNKETLRMLDIGTGSGNLAIAIASQVEQAIIDACDISEKGLDLALENAARAGVGDRVFPCFYDIFAKKIPPVLKPPYTMLVSNPPYVKEDDFDSLPPEIKNYEPKGALIGGEDGLRYYRRIAELADELLENGGALVVEIGEGQAADVRAIFRNIFRSVQVYLDLTRVERVVVGEGFGRD